MAAKEIRPLPFNVYFWTAAGIALAGLLDSLYLSFSHYRVHTDILYTSFCAVSKSINCDTVSQSPYSIFLGVPVPVWGIVGYGFFLLLLSFAKTEEADKKRIWPLLMVTAILFSAYSLILAYISRHYIRAYCIMCIVSYGLNFLLLYYGWLVRRRFPDPGFFSGIKRDLGFLWNKKIRCAYIFSPLLVSVVLLLLFFPNYWTFDMPALSSETPTGITEEGCPWIGAEDPELVITEFTDYMCFQCKKTHVYLRQLIDANPGKIRLVHRHFPMDHEFNPLVETPFHSGSAKLSVAAAYAAFEGKFWEMNDILYDVPRGTKSIDVKELAEESGVNFRGLVMAPHNKRLRYKVKHDIAKGLDLGITGTPAYVIKGKVYQGRIPVEIIGKVLEQ